MHRAIRFPVTWMLGDLWWLGLDQYYNRYHSSNGDDVEAEYFASLHQRMRVSMPWYVPSVSVAGAGEERDLQRAAAFGERARFGVSRGTATAPMTRTTGALRGARIAPIHVRTNGPIWRTPVARSHSNGRRAILPARI